MTRNEYSPIEIEIINVNDDIITSSNGFDGEGDKIEYGNVH